MVSDLVFILLLFRLYMSLLTDSLSEYSYNAEVAGLNYYVDQESQGMVVSFFFKYIYI